MIRIIADSTCSLPKNVLEKYNIKIAPFSVIIGEKVMEDYKNVSPDEFYQKLSECKERPIVYPPKKTKYLELFTEDVMSGIEEFIVITMNGYNGGSHVAAMEAKKQFLKTNKIGKVKIAVIDSRCVTHGYGYLVLKAAIMKDNCIRFKEIVSFIEKCKGKVKHFKAVGDFEYLAKSGMGKYEGYAQGELAVLSAKKGGIGYMGGVSGSSVFKYAAEEFIKTNDEGMTDFVIVSYTSDESYAYEMKEALVKEAQFKREIFIMQMASTAGAHIGLYGVGLYYMSKNKDTQFADMYTQFEDRGIVTA